jgi:DNA polymerase (family 10)
MPKADAQQVVKLLREYAQRTALRGGNPYRAKAYSRAADSLTALAEPLNSLVEDERLTEISRVGPASRRPRGRHHQAASHRHSSQSGEAPQGSPRRRAGDADCFRGCDQRRCCGCTRILVSPRLRIWKPRRRMTPIKEGKGLGAALQTKILQNLAIRQGQRRSASHASGGRPAAACKGGPRENPARTQTCDDRRRLQAGLRARR